MKLICQILWIIICLQFTAVSGLVIYCVYKIGWQQFKLVVTSPDGMLSFDPFYPLTIFGTMTIAFVAGYFAKPKKERPEWDFEKALNNKK